MDKISLTFRTTNHKETEISFFAQSCNYTTKCKSSCSYIMIEQQQFSSALSRNYMSHLQENNTAVDW